MSLLAFICNLYQHSTYVVVCHDPDSGTVCVMVQIGGVQKGRTPTERLHHSCPSAPLLVTVSCLIVVVHAVPNRAGEFRRTSYRGQGGQGSFNLQQQHVMVKDYIGHMLTPQGPYIYKVLLIDSHHKGPISKLHCSHTHIKGALYLHGTVHILTTHGPYIHIVLLICGGCVVLVGIVGSVMVVSVVVVSVLDLVVCPILTSAAAAVALSGGVGVPSKDRT